MFSMNMLYILSSVFILFFLIREYIAYKRYLRLKYFFTPSLTILLIMIMILSVTINGADRYRIMILLSLVTALAADTLLMIEEVDLLKNGMVFFIMSHLFYMGAFSIGASFRLWNLVPASVIVVLSLIYISVLKKTAGKMLVPVIVYIVILDLMVYFAVTSLNNGASTPRIYSAAGAVFFMISDFILSINAFVKKIPNSTVFTWLFYALAQFLIVLSTLKFLS